MAPDIDPLAALRLEPMGRGYLCAAAVFLPLSHYGLSSTRLRDVFVGRLGERGYLTLYSLVAVAAFVWLVSAYRQAPLSILWIAPQSLKLAMLPVVLVGFLLVVVGVTTPNPTTVGAEKLFSNPDVVRGILRVTRNPFRDVGASKHLLPGWTHHALGNRRCIPVVVKECGANA